MYFAHKALFCRKWASVDLEIKETNLSAVGRKYGVSGNAIKKWVKNYESEKKDVESDINI